MTLLQVLTSLGASPCWPTTRCLPSCHSLRQLANKNTQKKIAYVEHSKQECKSVFQSKKKKCQTVRTSAQHNLAKPLMRAPQPTPTPKPSCYPSPFPPLESLRTEQRCPSLALMKLPPKISFSSVNVHFEGVVNTFDTADLLVVHPAEV